MGPQVDVVDDSVDFLVGEQALGQTFVEEIVVERDDVVDGLDLGQGLDELGVIGLQDFVEHVVQIVFAELQHLVPGSVSLAEVFLDVALFSRLVDAPCSLEACLDVFLEQKVSEDQLVLVDCLL